MKLKILVAIGVEFECNSVGGRASQRRRKSRSAAALEVESETKVKDFSHN